MGGVCTRSRNSSESDSINEESQPLTKSEKDGIGGDYGGAQSANRERNNEKDGQVVPLRDVSRLIISYMQVMRRKMHSNWPKLLQWIPFLNGNSCDHRGVRATTTDGRMFLIHKGKKYGMDKPKRDKPKDDVIGGDTVVMDASNLSNEWQPVGEPLAADPKYNIGEAVLAAGRSYNACFNNCKTAVEAIINNGTRLQRKLARWREFSTSLAQIRMRKLTSCPPEEGGKAAQHCTSFEGSAEDPANENEYLESSELTTIADRTSADVDTAQGETLRHRRRALSMPLNETIRYHKF